MSEIVKPILPASQYWGWKPYPCGTGQSGPVAFFIVPHENANPQFIPELQSDSLEFTAFVQRLGKDDLEEVTDKTQWEVEATSIARFEKNILKNQILEDANNIARTVVVRGTFIDTDGKVYTDSTRVNVWPECIRVPADILLLLDASGSMAEIEKAADNQSYSRGALVVNAAKDLISSTNTDIFKIGLSQFCYSGTYQQLCDLTSDKTLLQSGIDKYHVYATPPNKTAIGDALLSAKQSLTGSKEARSDAKRAIILITDGLENTGNTPAAEAAATIKNAGITLIVIGIAVDSAAVAQMQTWASEGKFWSIPNAADLSAVIKSIPTLICREGMIEEFYYSGVPNVKNTNWKSCRGSNLWDEIIRWGNIGVTIGDNVEVGEKLLTFNEDGEVIPLLNDYIYYTYCQRVDTAKFIKGKAGFNFYDVRNGFNNITAYGGLSAWKYLLSLTQQELQQAGYNNLLTILMVVQVYSAGGISLSENINLGCPSAWMNNQIPTGNLSGTKGASAIMVIDLGDFIRYKSNPNFRSVPELTNSLPESYWSIDVIAKPNVTAGDGWDGTGTPSTVGNTIQTARAMSALISVGINGSYNEDFFGKYDSNNDGQTKYHQLNSMLVGTDKNAQVSIYRLDVDANKLNAFASIENKLSFLALIAMGGLPFTWHAAGLNFAEVPTIYVGPYINEVALHRAPVGLSGFANHVINETAGSDIDAVKEYLDKLGDTEYYIVDTYPDGCKDGVTIGGACFVKFYYILK